VRIAHVTTVDLTLYAVLLPQLRQLRAQGFDVTTVSAPGPFVAKLEAEGLRHLPWLNATRAWNPPADVRAFTELLGILHRERFDLVHTHTPKAGVLGRVAAGMCRVPCVVNTVHGLWTTPEDRLAKRLPVLAAERLAARFSDLELYVNGEDLAWARQAGVVRAERSRRIGNGVDLSRFHPAAIPPARVTALRRELGIADDELVVTAIGRLVAEKGYRELFAAAERVRAELPAARFLVAGGPDPDKADALGGDELATAAASGVVLCGWREDVVELLAATDVFVLPSHREGLPLSAVEAAAMGRPLVLTDIRGCREVVDNGRDGLLVPVRDPEALAAAITRLLRDPDLRARLGEAARRRAAERFDQIQVHDDLIGWYRKFLGSKVRGEFGRIEPGSPIDAADLIIRPATAADAGAIARLHREGLPEAFLPALGDRFLRRLYRALVRDPEGVAVVADSGAAIVGFAAGVASVPAFYRRFLRRHGLPAAIAATRRLLRPSVIRRAMETCRHPHTTRTLPDAELLAIAVDGACRTRGLGRRLAEEVFAGLAALGVGEVKAVVGADNAEANQFYARLGLSRAGWTVVHRGATSNVWILPEQAA
jgi:glycosyltransferase involved in cell wall biosynthesis/ribosomal protein S18 acetylase RimI-like enzyme